jgi:hypothetical protein
LWEEEQERKRKRGQDIVPVPQADKGKRWWNSGEFCMRSNKRGDNTRVGRRDA